MQRTGPMGRSVFRLEDAAVAIPGHAESAERLLHPSRF